MFQRQQLKKSGNNEKCCRLKIKMTKTRITGITIDISIIKKTIILSLDKTNHLGSMNNTNTLIIGTEGQGQEVRTCLKGTNPNLVESFMRQMKDSDMKDM